MGLAGTVTAFAAAVFETDLFVVGCFEVSVTEEGGGNVGMATTAHDAAGVARRKRRFGCLRIQRRLGGEYRHNEKYLFQRKTPIGAIIRQAE